MNEVANPYVAPTTTEKAEPAPSSLYLRESLVSLVWLIAAVMIVIGRWNFLPMFEDFGIELPVITLIAVSPWAFVASLLIGLSTMVISFAIDDRRTQRAFVSIMLLLALLTLAGLVLGLTLPLVRMLTSLS